MNRLRVTPEDRDGALANSKLASLMRGRRHTRASKIPRRDDGDPIEFVWVVLSGAQKQQAIAGALRRFDELKISPEFRYGTDIEDETAWQILGLAMRDPSVPGTDIAPYPRAFEPVDVLRDGLTIDERDILISEYMDLEESVDPDPLRTSEVWHSQIEAALKKSRPEAVRELSGFGSRTLIGYLLSTVAPRLTSPNGRFGSSPSSEPDSSDATPSEEPATANG